MVPCSTIVQLLEGRGVPAFYPSFMRNIFTIVAMMLATMAQANPIDMQKARECAQSYVPEGRVPMLCHSAKKRRAGSLGAPYYIFSRGEGQGYVIVAGDDCIPTIIGYTEQGDFDEAKEAPQMLALLDHYAKIVETLQAEGRNTPYESMAAGGRKVMKVDGRSDIPALLTSHWHQSSPYNDKVPKLKNGNRALTGCVATAGTQVFYYWRRDLPSAVPYTTPTYDFGDAPATKEYQIAGGTPLKWALMRDSYNTEPAEYKDAVATLLAAVGMQTYLEYGESTGGYIWKIPYDAYNLSAKQVNKDDGQTDDMWSALLYADLLKGHPIVYSGYLENWEGHALVVDGYRANGDLFHFNYGWGGQSDGYYTVRESGSNNIEFSMSPTVMYDIHPLKYNLTADIVLPETMYANAANDIVVKVTNKSSIPLSGIHLFANTTGKTPEKISDEQSADTETSIEVDKTVELTLTAKPTSEKTWYIIVTDDNLNVLATKTVEPKKAVSDLWVTDFRVDGNADTEQHGSDNYTVVYNNRASVSAIIQNKNSVGYEGAFRLQVSSSEDEGNTWNHLGYKAGRTTIPANGEQKLTIGVGSTSSAPIKEGVLYRVQLVNPIPNTNDTMKYAANADSLAYFVIKPADMVVKGFEDGVLKFEGHWDPTLFASNTMAGSSSYSTATAYDLTEVVGVAGIPTMDVNPNALYYLAADAPAQQNNVVKEGSCGILEVVAGHDFVPLADFLTAYASITFGDKVGKWYLVTVPFDAVVPEGIIARRIDGHLATGISGKTTDVRMMEAGKTYMVMSSHTGNMKLYTSITEDMKTVKAMPVENADTALVGTYRTMEAPSGAMDLNDASSQYFVFMEEGYKVEAMRGFFSATDVTRNFSACSNPTLDPAYKQLAESIDAAYGILYRYRDVVSEEAYDTFESAIKEAEKEFSNRTGSTLGTNAKILAYAEELLAKGDEYMKQVVRGDNVEVDFSSNIRNASFEMKTTTGWTLTRPLNKSITATIAAKVQANSSLNYFCEGTDGDYLLNNTYVYVSEEGVKDTLGVGISQQVSGLLPGYYRMKALVSSDEGNTITLFAGDSILTVEAHKFGKHYFTEAVIERVRVEATEADGSGTLNIGVNPGQWYKADNFQLIYVSALENGDDPDAIKQVVQTPRNTLKGIYTIQGQRLERITRPGIYIVDGKKMVIR